VATFSASALTHLLVVSDVDTSRDWYVDVLDASVYGEYGGTSVVLDLLGNWLPLATGGATYRRQANGGDEPARRPRSAQCGDHLWVDDCEAPFDLLSSRGAEFLTQPVDWGHERRAFLRDPDGHLFEISELRNPAGP
jgi:catechol 2,3-dioxygenase-like lactoylglutathione lyase family enzyme